MSKSISIACSAKMGAGTFEAKFNPLVQMDLIKQIIVLRKEAGPSIPKLTYRVLPKVCKNPISNMLITPILLAFTVWKSKADLILAYHYVPHFYIAFFASKLTGKPYVLGQTGSDDQLLAKKPIKGWFLRLVINNALQMNVPGKSSLRIWHSLGFNNVKVLHSTVDTSFYTPAQEQKIYDFVYTGRLEDYKGVDLMIEAASEVKKAIPEFKFAIVGYGSERQKYEARVRELGLTDNVYFMGYQRDVRQWLYKSRIFVMASDCEGLPCAMMEAMSCGMICMTSIVGNIGDLIIEGETGFGFAPRDKQRMVELMIWLYHREADLKSVRERARELIMREHSFQIAQALWTDVINRIVTE